jgi:Na+/serine symporter
MTEFELISLFNGFLDGAFSRLADFMAGTFAMLISAFFVGERLSQTMARLVVFLYTLFAVATAVPTLAISYRFTKTAELLKAMGESPDSMIGQIFPALPSTWAVMPVMALILGGAYAGTLVFFQQARKGLAPTGSANP